MDEGPQSAAELAGFAGRVAQEAADRAEAKLQPEVARLRHESLRWLAAQSRELVTSPAPPPRPRPSVTPASTSRRSSSTRGPKQMEAATEEMRQAVRSLGAEVGGRLEEQRARIAELERAIRELSVRSSAVAARRRAR